MSNEHMEKRKMMINMSNIYFLNHNEIYTYKFHAVVLFHKDNEQIVIWTSKNGIILHILLQSYAIYNKLFECELVHSFQQVK